MKKILSFKHPLLALAIVALAAVQAQAVPANPEPATVTQPDGSTLTVVLHGDEFYNFNTTADGYTIVPISQILLSGKTMIDNTGRQCPAK